MSQTTVDTAEVEQAIMKNLTAHDRCDGCGAQAYVRVEVPGGDLLFCGHHFAKSEELLRASGKVVQDEREALLVKP